MARLARIVIPKVAHHVTQRGNRRLPIFFSDDDRAAYLAELAAGCAASGTQCLAWCLNVFWGHNINYHVTDPDGRMLGEYDTSAADPVVENIWLSPEVANDNASFGGNDGTGGYAPLAIAGGTGSTATLYWVHGSHLGVPLVTTNASGAAATPDRLHCGRVPWANPHPRRHLLQSISRL